MSKPKTSASRRDEQKNKAAAALAQSNQAVRETVESIALAVVLAFLFRAFVAEAFVIPTGSMAPTLMGQHKDVGCPECGYWYQAGASIEIDDEASDQRTLEAGHSPMRSAVIATTCPLCRHTQSLDLAGDANAATFSGDRILVSKFVYDFTSPQRWDVIVFKYPFNAKQNFIKRLVGLPNEQVLIRQGDVFVKSPADADYSIARKPDHKLKAMLQLVDDSQHIAGRLREIGWPLRWQAWSAGTGKSELTWTSPDEGHTYETAGLADQDVWLRYHHILASDFDWETIEKGRTPAMVADRRGSLITDFYAYNAFTSVDREALVKRKLKTELDEYNPRDIRGSSLGAFGTLGLHWVSDLALEADVEVKSEQGELLFMLVKGGLNYTCRVDIATGKATLAIGNGSVEFVGADGTRDAAPVGQTSIQGVGTYRVRFSNVDAELRLWVNDRRIEFSGPTAYEPRQSLRPVTSSADPGDLAPVGIGTRGAAVATQRLRVLRDVYYVATRGIPSHEYRGFHEQEILRILGEPDEWPETSLFDKQDTFRMTLEDDQLFPLGDNSPQSSDARMWQANFVQRDLLIGKALLIYWPHPWYRPIPYFPNFKRMRLIH